MHRQTLQGICKSYGLYVNHFIIVLFPFSATFIQCVKKYFSHFLFVVDFK